MAECSLPPWTTYSIQDPSANKSFFFCASRGPGGGGRAVQAQVHALSSQGHQRSLVVVGDYLARLCLQLIPSVQPAMSKGP